MGYLSSRYEFQYMECIRNEYKEGNSMLISMILWLLSVQHMDCSKLVCNISNSSDNLNHYAWVCDPAMKPNRFEKWVADDGITFEWTDLQGKVNTIRIPTKVVSCGEL